MISQKREISIAWPGDVDQFCDCGTISFVRWLIAFGLVLFVAGAPSAQAGVFKGRGTGTDKTKPGATPAKPAAKETTTTAKKPAPAPAATPAKKPAAPSKAVAKKAPAKKPTSRVATDGRPKDLTPDPKKKDDVVVVEEEEDVIVRDLDDE